MELVCPFCKKKIKKTTDYVQRCPLCGYFFEIKKDEDGIVYIRNDIGKFVLKSEVTVKIGDKVFRDEAPTVNGKWKNITESELNKIGSGLAKRFSIKELEAAIVHNSLGDSVHGYLQNNFENYFQLIANYVLDVAVYYAKKSFKPTVIKLVKKISFCFTGALDSMIRAQLFALLKSKNHIFKTSVSSHVDYLVTNFPNKLTAKVRRARQLGIPIINEKQFLNMIN